MPPTSIIDFEWKRDPKGYRLVDSPAPRRLVRIGPNRSGVQCRPLSGAEYRIFARTARTPEGVLDFAQRYGPLTSAGWDRGKGDLVDLVISNALAMSELLDAACLDGRSTPVESGAMAPVSTFFATVIWDRGTKTPRWSIRPQTLLDALWLQFGQEVTRGAQIRACQHCSAWFEAGAGTGRRVDAKFCSDEHRITFNSRRRSRGD
jgi:hypothetical protein